MFSSQGSPEGPVFSLSLMEFRVYSEKRMVNCSQGLWHFETLKLSQREPGVIFLPLPKTYCYWVCLMGILWCYKYRIYYLWFMKVEADPIKTQSYCQVISQFPGGTAQCKNVTTSSHFSLSFLLPLWQQPTVTSFENLNNYLKTNMPSFSSCYHTN